MKRILHFNFICKQPKADEAISKLSKILFIFLLSVLPFSRLFSNNLVISVVSTDQTNQTVTFNLSWNNSWRDPGTTAANWDAAWVFIKWRDCTASTNVQYTHGLISTTLSDHNFNVGGTGTTFEPTLSDGSAVGIDASLNNTGVMLRNAASPIFGNVSSQITLKVTNLPSPSTTIILKAFAIEMVFIPSASYYLGDGNGTTRSLYSFASAVGGSTNVLITSESVSAVYESSTNFCLSGTCTLGANFPKGYGAFYIMKYEIMQQAYVDFLNTSSALVQSIHFTNQANPTNRHTIYNNAAASGGYDFKADRPYRACNFLSWADVGAYLDWAALRPLTELEYEKACRGTFGATPFETAFKQTVATRAAAISGAETGAETVTTANANIIAGSTAYSGGDAGQGPLRGGIFATATSTTRTSTGGSFYGVMELSGNVDEYYVSARSGVSTAPSKNGLTLGDGMLDDGTAHFTASGWPSPLDPLNYIIRRGGNWNTTLTLDGNNPISMCSRTGGSSYSRDATSGGRGGRSTSPTLTSVSGATPLTVTYSGSIVAFTVPAGVTSLTIEALGAGGGISSSTNAGIGARMKGVCAVTPGEVLQILVGGIGSVARSGGGGSFVVRAPYTTLASVLVVAGGGGGQGTSTTVGTAASKNGQLNGGTGGTGYNGSDLGGTNGYGGTGTCTGYGGGGGFLTNGTTSTYGGFAYINGGSGSTGSGTGGFGGGGTSGSSATGAGGGGYSGGGCSCSSGPGGGGGSIINGTVITNAQTGSAVGVAGQVILSW